MRPVLIVSTGCPSSIGPEISVRAAAALRGVPCILVGDGNTLSEAAELVGVERKKLKPLSDAFDRRACERGDGGTLRERRAEQVGGRGQGDLRRLALEARRKVVAAERKAGDDDEKGERGKGFAALAVVGVERSHG